MGQFVMGYGRLMHVLDATVQNWSRRALNGLTRTVTTRATLALPPPFPPRLAALNRHPNTCIWRQLATSSTMSSSEENFDLEVSGSESDGYVPQPKKKAAPAKKPVSKAAPKAAAKPKASKKTKVLSDKNDNADSDDDDRLDEDLAPAPEAGPSAPTNGNTKKKTASEMYTKVSSASCGSRQTLG